MSQEIINIKDKNSGLQVKNQADLFFYGNKESPFLAPRNAFIYKEKLLVSDTAQNRVFIWNKLPTQNYQTPNIIIGQSNDTNVQRNSGLQVNASTLLYPSAIWTNGQQLIIADAWNHRVLIWHTFPTKYYQEADVIIGQKDQYSNLPNAAGITAPPNAKTLYWCYGVYSDGKHLWIADTGNRRVLFYNTIPTQNFQAADNVIGKSSFIEKDYDNKNAIWPYAVKISDTGKLSIVDTQYYRVLIWNNWETAFTQKADTIIGQQDFDGNGQNQYRLRPMANTLSWCYDACFVKNNAMLVADTGNSRILLYNNIPHTNNEKAHDLYGNIHFEAIGEHLETGIINHQRLYWPFSVNYENNLIVVADTGNHRIAFYTLK